MIKDFFREQRAYERAHGLSDKKARQLDREAKIYYEAPQRAERLRDEKLRDRKNKGIWDSLFGENEREIKKIENARARRDDNFFEDWFDRFNKPERSNDFLGESGKGKKDDWL